MIEVDSCKCLYCGGCVGLCPTDALTLYETRLEVGKGCNDCGICIQFCPVGALEMKK